MRGQPPRLFSERSEHLATRQAGETRPRVEQAFRPASKIPQKFTGFSPRGTRFPSEKAFENDIVIRDMSWTISKLVPRSAPVILVVLTLAAAVSFAAVSHLVARFTANQQARGRKLYTEGLAHASAAHYDDAIDAFRAALTCDPANSQYQLSLARALRDSNDPRRLDEAESYLLALWQRAPQDAAVNLALARVAAHRGSIEDATRYYHNAMYGVWNSDPDGNRSKARIELIQFLLKKKAPTQAESELMALAPALPPDPAAHLQAAQLFQQAQDSAGALGQYQEVLRLDAANPAAQAGAGQAAYRSGNYATAQRYLEAAVNANPQDADSSHLLATADLILRTNPFHSHISDAERNRRITAAFEQAEKRLTECAQQQDISLIATSPASPLASLQSRWTAAKPNLARLRSAAETDLPDAIMDIVFQIEQQTAATCGQPQDLDLALLLISQKREAASQ
jgi:tetratricopeptide (TPR) repeat protein